MKKVNLLLFLFLISSFISFAQDPAATVGATGTVSFTYLKAPVVYPTIRAADGRIWLQKNLGATSVASSAMDANGLGDLFQWGRWDDSGQLRNAPAVAIPAVNNPSGLSAINKGYFYQTFSSGAWWTTMNGNESWSGTTASATNGIDPCTSIGPDWRLPTVAEWTTLLKSEGVVDTLSGINSRMKLTMGGQKWFQYSANLVQDAGYYWAGGSIPGAAATAIVIQPTGVVYGKSFLPAPGRGFGNSLRCVKIVAPTTGCTGTPQAPVATGPANKDICTNTPLTLSGIDPNTTVTGITYQWQESSSATGTFTAVTTGTGGTTTTYTTPGLTTPMYYRLVASCGANSANSNVLAMSVRAQATATATVSVSATSVCLGDTVVVTASGTDTGTNPNYTWYINNIGNGTTGKVIKYVPTITTNPFGTNDSTVFSVVINNNAYCVTSASTTSSKVTVKAKPLVTPVVTVTPSPNDTVCNGTAVTFTPTDVNGGTAPIHEWYKNGASVSTGNTYTYTPVNKDTITVIMTSNAACLGTIKKDTSDKVGMTVTSSVTPAVTISVSPNDTVCTGTAVTFTPSATYGGVVPSYQWQKNGSTVATTTNYTYTPTANDSVSVVMTSDLSCVTSPTANSNKIGLNVLSMAAPSVTVTASPNDTVCAGTAITLTATPTNGGSNATYQWVKNGSNTATGATYTYTPTGNDAIVATLTSNALCITTPTANSNQVDVHTIAAVVPTITVAVSPNDTVCNGTSVTFTATTTNGGSGATYQWTKNNANVGTSATYNYSPVNGDSVSCTLTSNATCATPATVKSVITGMVVNPLPTKPVIAPSGADLNVGSGYTTYQWYIDGQPVPGAENSSFTPSQSGEYTVKVSDGNGCENTSDAYHFVLSVNSLTANNVHVTIYPNPANNVLYVKATENVNVALSSMDGRSVLKQNNTAVVNISTLADGIYIIRVTDNAGNVLKIEKVTKGK